MSTAASRSPGRPRDPEVTGAIVEAALRLVAEEGFARMTMESVAKAAGVGKPAVYRRFRDKADLVATAVGTVMRVPDPPDLGDTEAELRQAFRQTEVPDPEGWVGFIGGLFAEHRRHPDLVEAFRESVLLPRRAAIRTIVERGQARGDLRTDIDAETLIDHIVGPLIARIYSGRPLDDDVAERAFEIWWDLARARPAGG